MDNRLINSHPSSRWDRFGQLSGYLIVFGLMGFYIIDIALYYIGFHANEKLHITSLVGISVIIFIMAILRFYRVYMIRSDMRLKLLLSSFVLLCGGLIFIAAFILYGYLAVKNSMFYFLQYGCFGVPAFIFGIDTALNQKEKILFRSLDSVALFFILMAVWFIGWLNVKIMYNIPYEDAIGGMSFMTLAYAIMQALMFMSLSTIFPAEEKLYDRINSKLLSSRMSNVVRLSMILLFWLVIIAAATRGAQLSIVLFFFIVLLYALYIRNNKIFWRSAGILIGLVFIYVLLMFVVKPSFIELSMNKTNIIVESYHDGNIASSTTKAVDDKTIDLLVAQPLVPEIDNKKQISAIEIDKSKLIMNREQMYKAAFEEFKKSPVYGIGPLGFIVKYGRYPHNIVLETMCDYGIVGVTILFGGISLLLLKLIRASKRDLSVGMMTLILLGFNLPLLFSGEFLAYAPFWFFMGYSIVYDLKSNRKGIGINGK